MLVIKEFLFCVQHAGVHSECTTMQDLYKTTILIMGINSILQELFL